jgi:hypothetical protein
LLRRLSVDSVWPSGRCGEPGGLLTLRGSQRAYSAATGKVLWSYDTMRDVEGVNGLPGRGGALSGGGGAVVSHGLLYTQRPATPSPFLNSDQK